MSNKIYIRNEFYVRDKTHGTCYAICTTRAAAKILTAALNRHFNCKDFEYKEEMTYNEAEAREHMEAAKRNLNAFEENHNNSKPTKTS